MNIIFSQHRPSADLLPFVQTYWFGDFNISRIKEYTQSVVPNGCVELIIHLTNEHCALEKRNNAWRRSPDFTILGMYTQPYQVKFASRVNVFGIRFFPDGIRNIFGVPPSHFISSFQNSADVFGKHLGDFCAKLRDLLSLEDRLQFAEGFIRSQLQMHYRSYDYTHQTMKLIRSITGQRIYQHVKEKIPISERQLQREFRNQYGITVREYIRLTRMNAIYNYMHSDRKNLAQFANEVEFFDQSHFIREFKNYVGISPLKFMKNRQKFIVNPAVAEA